ncbi:MAG: hypothetical protein NTX82_05280 [Candidatus Parcubacteria bacterium]|nr:hypothetical protein [Candidatus Parcubacteria bacterium]
MTKTEWDKGQFFQMALTNLRDDFILGRRTQIDADAKTLSDAWKDLTDKQKKEAKPKAVTMLKLFIENLPSVGGNTFLEQYRQAFHEEPGIPEPRQFSAMRIFRELLAEIESVE